MAKLISTTYRGLDVPAAYVRIVGIEANRDALAVGVRYAVFASQEAAELVYPDRSRLTAAEAELAAYVAIEGAAPEGLTYRQGRVQALQREYNAGIKPASPPLEIEGAAFPYSPDVTVAVGYALLDTLPKFADSIDI